MRADKDRRSRPVIKTVDRQRNKLMQCCQFPRTLVKDEHKGYRIELRGHSNTI